MITIVCIVIALIVYHVGEIHQHTLTPWEWVGLYSVIGLCCLAALADLWRHLG